MKRSSLETTDIFRGAFYLCMSSDLSHIRFKNNGKQIARFLFTGPDLDKHDKAYTNALVNPVQFREALNINGLKWPGDGPAFHDAIKLKIEKSYELRLIIQNQKKSFR